MMDGIAEIYALTERIQDPIMREFTRSALAKAWGAGRASQRPHRLRLVLHAMATAQYADKLCDEYQIGGVDRDAVLAACTLRILGNQCIIAESIDTVAQKLDGHMPKTEIILSCTATLTECNITRNFPAKYSIYEIVVFIADVMVAQQVVHLANIMRCSKDNFMLDKAA